MAEVVEDPQWIQNLESSVDSAFASVTKWSGKIIFFEIPGIPMPFVVMWLLAAAIIITTPCTGCVRVNSHQSAVLVAQHFGNTGHASGDDCQ